MNYERVFASEVRVGDRIARTRTANFHTVTAVQFNEETVWLAFERPASPNTTRIRPHLDAKLWREVPA